LSAVALYITVELGHYLGLRIWIEPGIHAVVPAIIAVAVLAVVNAIIRPVVQFIALPITCLTLGLFSLVINGLMFWLVGQVVPGFDVKGFWAPIYGAIMMGLLSGLLNNFLNADDKKQQD
jgi:putative membrane protein